MRIVPGGLAGNTMSPVGTSPTCREHVGTSAFAGSGRASDLARMTEFDPKLTSRLVPDR